MIITLLLLCTIANTRVLGSDEDELDRFPNDMEYDIIRRNMHAQEWQFEGMPIEAPESARRAMGNTDAQAFKSQDFLSPEILYRGFETEFTSIEVYPFIAALLMNDQMWCTGVIIASDKILADAYCLQLQYKNRFNRELVKVLNIRVGSSNATAGGTVYKATEIIFHPNYKPHNLEFNFAVVKISKNMTFGETPDVSTAKYSYRKTITADMEITFVGWGYVYAITDGGKMIVLKRIILPVYNLADCQDIHGRDIVTATNFCAGYISKPANICYDMGGAAIAEGEVVGLLSFAAIYCDHPDRPAVFSTIGRVTEWFESL